MSPQPRERAETTHPRATATLFGHAGARTEYLTHTAVGNGAGGKQGALQKVLYITKYFIHDSAHRHRRLGP